MLMNGGYHIFTDTGLWSLCRCRTRRSSWIYHCCRKSRRIGLMNITTFVGKRLARCSLVLSWNGYTKRQSHFLDEHLVLTWMDCDNYPSGLVHIVEIFNLCCRKSSSTAAWGITIFFIIDALVQPLSYQCIDQECFLQYKYTILYFFFHRLSF